MNGDDVSFVVTFAASTGWFALGVSSDGSMNSGSVGSDVVVCDNAGVKRYWITAKSAPKDGISVDGATCKFADGKGVLTFTRALKASGAKQRDMLGAGSETTLKSFVYFVWYQHMGRLYSSYSMFVCTVQYVISIRKNQVLYIL